MDKEPIQYQMASIHGKAVFTGDRMYSVAHGIADLVQYFMVDNHDREVYVVFEKIGQAKLNSCLPY